MTGPGAPTSKWQQPFDAAITDVFQVQSEIATKVAQALGVALGAGEEKRLSEKPTQNLAAYDAFLKGEEIRNSGASDPASLRKELGFYEQAVALDPGFAQAWARVSGANSLLYAATAPPRPRSRSVPGRRRRRPSRLRRTARRDTWPSGVYERYVSLDFTRALEQYEKGLRLAPGDASALRGDGAGRAGPRTLGCGGGAPQAGGAPRSPVRQGSAEPLATRSFVCGAIPRRGRLSTVVSPSRLPTSSLIEYKAMTYLGEGDLAGARAVLKAAPKEVEPTALVAYLATYWISSGSSTRSSESFCCG